MSKNNDSRGRGILTPTDRKFLRGKKEYSNPETAAHRRSDIRDRVVDSILDFKMLVEDLPEGERKKIFSRIKHREDLPYLAAFLFLGVEAESIQDTETSLFLTEFNLINYERAVHLGAYEGLKTLDFLPVRASAEVSVPGYFEDTIEHLKKQIHEGKAGVGVQEVRALLAAGEVDGEQIADVVKEEIEPPFDVGELEDSQE